MPLEEGESKSISDNSDRIHDIPAQFNDGVFALENGIFNSSLELIDLFSYDDENRIIISESLPAPSEISNGIRNIILASGFVGLFSSYLDEFDRQAENNFNIIKSTMDVEDLTLSNTAASILQQQKTNLLLRIF